MKPEAATDIPLISVIIPVYNGERYIAETIRSVLSQTEQRFEIIAVNDGSTDGSLQVLEKLRSQYSYRIKVLTVNNSGVSKARNTGVKAALGTYIAFIDQDDLWTRDKLERQLLLHETSPAPLISFTNEAVIDEDGSEISDKILRLGGKNKGNVFEELLFDNFIPVSSLMIPKELFVKAGEFNPAYHLAEDFDFLLRAAQVAPFDFIDEPLLRYRQHKESDTYQKIDRITQESFAVLSCWKKKRPDVFRKNLRRYLLFKLKFVILKLKVRGKYLVIRQ
jgi:glycosyltransferase involved in cell wall biosynthesis